MQQQQHVVSTQNNRRLVPFLNVFNGLLDTTTNMTSPNLSQQQQQQQQCDVSMLIEKPELVRSLAYDVWQAYFTIIDNLLENNQLNVGDIFVKMLFYGKFPVFLE